MSGAMSLLLFIYGISYYYCRADPYTFICLVKVAALSSVRCEKCRVSFVLKYEPENNRKHAIITMFKPSNPS